MRLRRRLSVLLAQSPAIAADQPLAIILADIEDIIIGNSVCAVLCRISSTDIFIRNDIDIAVVADQMSVRQHQFELLIDHCIR